MPGVLKRYDAATGTWIPTVGAPQAQPGLLAIKSHRTGTDTTVATTSTTAVAVDATNLSATFTVPASGAITVSLAAAVNMSAGGVNLYWSLHDGTTGLGEQIISNTSDLSAPKVTFLLTGLTPGAVKTLQWRHRVNGGTGSIYVGPTYGAAVMEVWDAQTGAGVFQALPTNMYAGKAYNAAAYALPSLATTHNVPLDTVAFGDASLWNLASDSYVAPVAGIYKVDFRTGLNPAAAGGERFITTVEVNGSAALRGDDLLTAAGSYGGMGVNGLVSVATAGHLITPRIIQYNGTVRTLEGGATTTWMTVHLVETN